MGEGLVFKGEIDGADEEEEGDHVVPAEVGVLEENEGKDDEDYQCDNFLHHFELDKREGTAVAIEADAVCGNLEAIFNESDAPGEEDDGNEGPVSADAG